MYHTALVLLYNVIRIYIYFDFDKCKTMMMMMRIIIIIIRTTGNPSFASRKISRKLFKSRRPQPAYNNIAPSCFPEDILIKFTLTSAAAEPVCNYILLYYNILCCICIHVACIKLRLHVYIFTAVYIRV